MDRSPTMLQLIEGVAADAIEEPQYNPLVSPASLLDSQHGCIASPHAKKESGQTPLAVRSPLVQDPFLGLGSGFDCCGVWFYSSLLTVRPHLLTVQDQTANRQTPSSRAVMQYTRV